MEKDITSSTSDTEQTRDSSSPALYRTASAPVTDKDSPSSGIRQNQVTSVMLAGVPIVCLFIDNKERLCLAQISNTLLKNFSYNEIHNRRVALGITCVQCTPVQLEILRRAGAMPISSRRCGMITKREAERLVKSFLEDNAPPKLPDNFCFEVEHGCGWGSRGKFEPSRYNSSRAKCIKCSFCNLYFSPNKFIFHFHRAPDSKYSHPDAANFNSWRRHLNLVQGHDADDIAHAWEDVKAMFNGGSRKRMVSLGPGQNSSSAPSSEPKKPKLQTEENVFSKPNYSSQYPSYPVFSIPGKTYPFNPLATPNPMGMTFPIRKDCVDGAKGPSFGSSAWRSPSDFIIPPYDLLWANQFNIRSRAGNYDQGFFLNSSVKESISNEHDRHSPSDSNISSEDDDVQTANGGYFANALKPGDQRLSAFRPVYKSDNTSVEQTLSENDHENDGETSDIDIEDDTAYEKDQAPKESPVLEDSSSRSKRIYSPDTSGHSDTEILNQTGTTDEGKGRSSAEFDQPEVDNEYAVALISNEEAETEKDDVITPPVLSDAEILDDGDLSVLSKGELQQQLEREMATRKQIEQDVGRIKGSYEDQVNREKSHRNEIARQLQIVKDALCNELAQERKLRYSMQQKLKEAHDALHSFSCKMLASRQCAECAFKQATSPR